MTAPAALGGTDQRAKLATLREELARRGVDALCIPRADEYLGEYIPAHNERLRWLTDFTGSAGMAIVTANDAAIFTDGRYTVQVRRQVDGEEYQYRQLLEEPPLQWLSEHLAAGSKVLIDPRMCTLDWYREAQEALSKADIQIVLSTDNPIDRCWTTRPAPLIKEALLLEESFTGEHSLSKRERLGKAVAEAGADAALIFAPDSISWLLNVRGRDVPRMPVLLGCALLESNGHVQLLVDERRIPEGFHEHTGPGVSIIAEDEAGRVLSGYAGKTVLADPTTANAWSQQCLEEGGATLLSGEDPVLLPKACKNTVEVAGAREAHRRDAVAEIRFLAWLDGEVAAGRYHDEGLVAERLEAFRAEGKHFHELSFDSISASAANGAMCHYNHLDSTPAPLVPDSLYLVDSGGQYSDGTTDITRTIAIGEPSQEMRELFTLVLKGHISLDRARFPRGTTGTHLDVLARQHLWQTGRDYDHGTGHGVGAFLGVHEGPQRIAKAWNRTPLAPGMIVSNEPGYYRDGAFGIRCENLCVVREAETASGEVPMLEFDALTLVPFDRRLIDSSLLSPEERQWIDDYHLRVAEEIMERLEHTDDRDWLRAATRPLS
ncbi:aminopeptidase P family protein [Congregibacter litoralis]|uniref:Xaa-Pro aminopeptidase n=1 Tax=Congregibacter litoralis KT71 TaxID=314285 RepID=A4A5K9_9GAMM|nr:aminopeptidase P family protein [Congregibacter litoralis]EAQ99080.1 Xaa-Pro aminopeptidase [Congregibacter litoralis KT71]